MQMSSKNTTEVIIGGKVFTLGGYETYGRSSPQKSLQKVKTRSR